MDETAASLEPPLVRGWRKRGCQSHVCASSGSQAMVHIFGGMDLVTGMVTSVFCQSRTSSDFIAFLEELMRTRYPTQNVILILDNASFHTSGASRAAFALFEDRLHPFFLPPHSPELNPIERFWRHLKEKALGNRFCPNLQDVKHHLLTILALQNNPASPHRYCV